MEKEKQCIAVMHVEGMPRACRPQVEHAMATVIASDPMVAQPGADIWDGGWYTRWARSAVASGAVDCRQVLSGTSGELDAFGGVLAVLAGEYGFRAHLELVG